MGPFPRVLLRGCGQLGVHESREKKRGEKIEIHERKEEKRGETSRGKARKKRKATASLPLNAALHLPCLGKRKKERQGQSLPMGEKEIFPPN